MKIFNIMFYYFVQLTKYFNILLNILLGHQNFEMLYS